MTKKPTGTVRVRMTARQVVTYDQVRELSREQWEQLKKESPEAAAEWIDVTNIDDGQEMEEFDAYVCDEEGKPVKPTDRYDGCE